MSSRRRFENSGVYPPMDVGPDAYYEGGGTEQGGYGYHLDSEIGFMEAESYTPVVSWGPVRGAGGLPPDLAAEFMAYDLADAREASYGYGITTDLSKMSKTGGGFFDFIDYMFGGFEKEDVAASSTAGGINTRTGLPTDPNAAASVAESIGQPDYNPYDSDTGGKRPPPDWKRLAIVVGAVGGGFALWKFVIAPRIGKKGEGA